MSERGDVRDGGAGGRPGSQVEKGAPTASSSRQNAPAGTPSVSTTRGVVTPVVIALVISVFFVTLFLLAFRSPTPHDLQVGLTGPTSATEQLRQTVADRAPGMLDFRDYSALADAQAAVEHRDVYAALVIDQRQWTLLVAGANGSALLSALPEQLEPAAVAAGARLRVHDVVPRAPGDISGLAIFYAAFGLVLGGFLFGVNTYQVAPRLSFRARMGSVALFGPLCGVGAAVAGRALDALEGSLLANAAILTLIATAVGMATAMLLRAFGLIGITLGSLLLLTLGNASSAAVFPPALLPGWLEPFADLLPPGAGVRALAGAAYFGGGGVLLGVSVLVAWIAVSALVIFSLDRRAATMRTRTGTHTPPVGAESL